MRTSILQPISKFLVAASLFLFVDGPAVLAQADNTPKKPDNAKKPGFLSEPRVNKGRKLDVPQALTDFGDRYLLETGEEVTLLRATNEAALILREGADVEAALRAATDSAGVVAPRPGAMAGLSKGRQMALVRSADRGRGPEHAALLRLPGVIAVRDVLVDPRSKMRMIPSGELIVRLKANFTLADLQADFESAGLELVQPVGSARLKMYLVRQADLAVDSLVLARQLAQNPKLDWATPNFVREVELFFTPNDPLFGHQQHLHNTGQQGGVVDADVDAPAAWDISQGSSSIVIAIIDDGIDTSHADLTIRTNPGETGGGKETNGIDDDGNGFVDDWRGWDFVNNDNNPNPAGDAGHGTACAGVAAAKINNAYRTTGIAGNCRVLPVKIFSDTGVAVDDLKIASAISYAVDNGADVLSDSWGGGSPSAAINTAIADAVTNGRGGKGCPVFFANGNGATIWGKVVLNVGANLGAGSFSFGFRYEKDGSYYDGEDLVKIDNVVLIDGDNYTHINSALGTSGRQDFEGAFPPTGWSRTSSAGAALWTTTTAGVFGGTAGTKSARSGAIGDSQWTELRTPNITLAGDETLTFQVYVSSEYGWDGLDIRVYTAGGTYLGYYGTFWGVYDAYTPIGYPANNANSISVGASTDCDRRSDYSEYGPENDFVAPSNGGWNDITTLDPTGAGGYSSSDYTSTFGGTSSATPLAAGVGALILSVSPNLTHIQVRDIMRNTADKIGPLPYVGGFNNEYGYGRVNASAALASLAPEIEVRGNGVVIVDGDATPSLADHTDFGSTPRGGATVSRIFTVRNIGTRVLNTAGLTVPAGYTVTDGLAASIPENGQDTFTVRLNTGAAGTFSGDVSFTCNDASESPFNFRITGTVTAPEIQVLGNGAIILDGDATPSLADHTDFGTTSPGVPVSRTYTVQNIGTATLTTSGLSVPAGYAVTEALSASIAAGAQDTFTVRLNAASGGTFAGDVSFTCNDSDENPFNFRITGAVIAEPEIEVLGNGVVIVDGDVTPSASDYTDFGMTPVGTPVSRTYTVRNTGGAALTTSALAVPAGYTVTDVLLASIPAGGQDTFTVRFDAASAGTFAGDVSFTCNDSNENPFNFRITGQATECPTAIALVTGFTPAAAARNNYSGWVGMRFRVGPNPIDVQALGRVFLNGNTRTHPLRLVRVSDGAIMASVVWPAVGVHNQISYMALDHLVTLAANTDYYLASQETSGLDSWYSFNTAVTTTPAATVLTAVYSDAGVVWTPYGTAGSYSYGPVSLRYCGGEPPVPPTGVVATDGDPSLLCQVRVSWAPSAGATSYKVYRDGSVLGSVAASPFFDAPGDVAVHTYNVTASNENGESGPSLPDTGFAYCPPCNLAAWVTGFTPGTVRNNYGGWVGNKFRVGGVALDVRELGRIYLNNNTQNHLLRLVRVSDGVTVGSTLWTPAGGIHNQIKYVPLPAPVILAANTEYYLASQEVNGGDSFYSFNTVVVTLPVATVQTPVYSDTGTTWVPYGTPGSYSYGPVSFRYCGCNPPAAPDWVNAQDGGDCRGWVLISWASVADVTGYQVFRDAVLIGERTPDLTYFYDYPGNNDPHSYTVKSVNACGTSPASAADIGYASVAQWVTAFTAGTLRNNYSGWVGVKFRVGALPVDAGQLGRIFLNGNTRNHTLRLVKASDGSTVASAVWTPAGGTHNQIKYVPLEFIVTLAANTEYIVTSQEASGGDSFYSYNTAITTTPVATPLTPVYSDAGAVWTAYGTPGSYSYGPVSFGYCGGQPPAPPTAVTATDADQSIPCKVRVSWTASAGATSYQVFRDGTQVGSVAASPFEDTPGDVSVHAYTVKATNAYGSSGASAPDNGSAYCPSCTLTIWVTGFSPGTLRNNYSGWVGNRFRVGPAPIEVRDLGRIYVNNNAQNHALRIVRVSDGATVASATWTPAGGAHNEMKYVPLAGPVFLAANTEYYIASQEVAGGDSFYSYNTVVVTMPVAAVQTPVYSDNGTTWVPYGTAGSYSYGPVSFRYCGSACNEAGLITSYTPGTLRNNYSGWIGMRLQTAANPVEVRALGRLVLANNAGSHTVRLVRASTGVTVGSVSWTPAGGTVGQFKYVALGTPVTLDPNTEYFLASQETSGGDTWYSFNTAVTSTTVAAVETAMYSDNGSTWVPYGTPGSYSYGPVSLTYCAGTPQDLELLQPQGPITDASGGEDQTDNAAADPVAALTSAAGAVDMDGYLVLEYLRIIPNPSVEYVVEASEDALNWTPTEGLIEQNVVPADAETELVRVRLLAPLSDTNIRYLRLRIVGHR